MELVVGSSGKEVCARYVYYVTECQESCLQLKPLMVSSINFELLTFRGSSLKSV